MAEYRLGPVYLGNLRKGILLRVVPVALVAGGVGVFMGSGVSGQGPLFWAMLIPLMGGSLGYGLYRAFQQQKKAGDSYRLFLEEDGIRRVQEGLAEAVIQKDGIVKIFEAKGRGMTIRPVSGVQVHIPATLEGYDEVRARLIQWHEFEVVSKDRVLGNQVLTYLAMAVVLGLMWVTYSSHEARMVEAAGILLVLVLVVSFGFILWSKEVPTASKKAAWVGIFVLLSVAYRIWMAFQGRIP